MFLAIECKINEYLLAFNPEGELKDKLEGVREHFQFFSLFG